MDKAGALIERLFEQYTSNAGTEQLRATVQLLLYELENKLTSEKNNTAQQLVSIFFPASTPVTVSETFVLPEVKKETAVKVEEKPVQQIQPAVNIKEEKDFFDPMVEIPTLALKQQEVNESIAKHESLNDSLKSIAGKRDVGSKMKEVPIKDLRKAIGVNDQYFFINELFRGDQTMYERSIKTINNFNIYGEAELWIKRELKLKLAWPEENEVVQLFDQLIKRRFS